VRIGVFGGSFDPIHLGHIKIAIEAHSQYSLDKVIFSPLSSTWEQKSAPIADPEQRAKMCELALNKYDFFEVSYADIKRGGVTRSINTVSDIIRETKNKHLIYLIIGEDSAYQINKWEQSKELLAKTEIIVAPRNLAEKGEINKDFNFINIDKIDVSSSTIRENIKMEKKWDHLVAPNIFKYIVENKVYK
jgi:nicotinate-nucleotide adenylyltransferase